MDSLSISPYFTNHPLIKKALERWLTTDDRINKIKNDIKLLLCNKRNLITDKQEDILIESKKTIKVSKRAQKDLSYDE